jgi:3-dehydroquinate synthetase
MWHSGDREGRGARLAAATGPAGEAPLDERGVPVRLDWYIEQAVRIKAAYVAADPNDEGVRQSLNLGHTFAHGVEAASGYRVPHGEAVAVGLVAAAHLAADTAGTSATSKPGGASGSVE